MSTQSISRRAEAGRARGAETSGVSPKPKLGAADESREGNTGSAGVSPKPKTGAADAALQPAADDAYAALRLDHQLCFPLYAASRKIINIYTPILKPLGITYTQYITFMALWENDCVPVGDLCARLHLDNGTLTPLLKKMEKEGYITRRRDSGDERKVRICLTDAGRAMREKARDIPRQVGRCLRITPEEARTLYRILYEIIDG